MSIEAAIAAAVAQATDEVASKIKETFVENASAHVGGTGNYIASITDKGGGMEHTILADPAAMGLNSAMTYRNIGDFWHGSFGNDAREGMTAILGDGKCGPLSDSGKNGAFSNAFGHDTVGKNRHKFWPDIENTVEANIDAWTRAALAAAGLEVI